MNHVAQELSITSEEASEIDHEPIEHGIITSITKGALSGMFVLAISLTMMHNEFWFFIFIF